MFLFISAVATGQDTLKPIKLHLKVQDSATGIPITDASVYILDDADENVIRLLNSDSSGTISDTITLPGRFLSLQIYSQGYKKFNYRQPYNIRAVDLGDIRLASSVKVLGGITVKKQIPPVKFFNNSMEFNIASVPKHENMSMLDILDYLPFLMVNAEDKEVKFMGSPLVILINNREHPFYSKPGNLNYLPPNAIERIEVNVISTARNGNNRVMNVTLRRNYFLGWRGNANANISRFSQGLQTAASYWKNNFGLDIMLGAEIRNRPSRSEWQNVATDKTVIQSIRSRYKNRSASVFGTMFYNLDSLQTIDVQIGYTPGTAKVQRSSRMEMTEYLNRLFQKGRYLSQTDSDNLLFGLNYNKKFRNGVSELMILTQFSDSKVGVDVNSNVITEDGQPVSDIINLNNSANKEFTIEVISVKPIVSKIVDMTAGAKTILRTNRSNYRSVTTTGSVSGAEFTNADLKFNQAVVSIYWDGDFRISKKISVHSGLRFEHANSIAENDSKFKQRFNNILPNLSLSYSISENGMMSIGYYRDVRRPDFNYAMTSFQVYQNSYYSDSGNINLKPQYSNKFDLQYYGSIKSLRIGGGFNYTSISDFVDAFYLLGDSVSMTHTFANSFLRTFTLSLNFEFQFLKKFRFSHFCSGSLIDNKGLGYHSKRMGYYIDDRLYYNVAKNHRISASLNAFAPNVTLQGREQSMDYLNTRFGYSYFLTLFKNCPSTFGISISNPWSKGLRSYVRQTGPNFFLYSRTIVENPVIGIQIAVNVRGKQRGARNFNRSKSIENNDVIKGE